MVIYVLSKGTRTEREDMKKHVELINSYYERLGKAIDNNDNAAADKYSDLYENGIEHYAKKYGYTYNQFEDICTSTRMFGWDMD